VRNVENNIRLNKIMKTLKIVLLSFGIGISITIGTNIPIISMIIGLGAFPILKLDGFEKTGNHVEYGPFWLTLKSMQSWIFFILYYSIIVFIIILFILIVKLLIKIIFKKK
jgi:hypothetical protein